MNRRNIALILDRAAWYPAENAGSEGAWVEIRTTVNSMRGLAQYDENFDVVALAREIGHAEFADGFVWINPEHIVTINYAEAGA